MQDMTLSAPRNLNTPDRDTLLRIHLRHERFALAWLALEAAAAFGCVAWMVARGGPGATAETIALVTVSALGLFDFVPALWATRRKPLRDIRTDASFGPHSRDSLLSCVDRVASHLGIHAPCPVYLVRDKNVNAHAMPLSLLPGVGSFTAVHLNRSIVHLLDEPELESVIGHEFGHVFRFCSIASRCMLIHVLFAAGLTLAIADVLRGTDFRVAAPLIALWPARWLAFSSTRFMNRVTEFLCDDYGAAASGTEAAMKSHLKMAMEQEARTSLIEQILEARLRGGDVPLETLLQTYESALPFGHVSPKEAELVIRDGIKQAARTAQGVSLLGFWRFLAASDEIDEESLRESIVRGRVIRGLSRVSVRPQDVVAGTATLEECVSAIENEPNRLLVHLADEIEDRDDTHPNCSRRLLFLWRSRGPSGKPLSADA
jgi:Zn-dependent protease with chaperone function